MCDLNEFITYHAFGENHNIETDKNGKFYSNVFVAFCSLFSMEPHCCPQG